MSVGQIEFSSSKRTRNPCPVTCCWYRRLCLTSEVSPVNTVNNWWKKNGNPFSAVPRYELITKNWAVPLFMSINSNRVSSVAESAPHAWHRFPLSLDRWRHHCWLEQSGPSQRSNVHGKCRHIDHVGALAVDDWPATAGHEMGEGNVRWRTTGHSAWPKRVMGSQNRLFFMELESL